MHTDGKTKTERLTFIDGLRGIAALGVALHHLDAYRPHAEEGQSVFPHWLQLVFENGWMGVQIFFVISGFVIAYSLRSIRITPEFYARFALSRWMRLAPAYLVAATTMVIIECASPWLGIQSPSEQALNMARVTIHLFYMQDIVGYESLSAGFWTLCIEMQFYLVFALLVGLAQNQLPANSSVGTANLIVCLPLALVSLYVFHRDPNQVVWLTYFFWMFFLGALTWWVLDGQIDKRWLLFFVAAIAVRLCLEFNLRGLVALLSGVTIYVVGRCGRLTTWLDIYPVQYLGRISYSFYLIHYAVNHLVVSYGYSLTGMGKLPELTWFVLSLSLSLVAAHCLYLTIERPSLRWSQWIKRTPLLGPDRRRQTAY